MGSFSIGDHVIYHKQKTSPQPGPRAANIRPAEHGEDYSYAVNKFWTVADTEDNTVVVQTRRGKLLRIDHDDARLRKASYIEKLRYKDRFPALAPPREAQHDA